VALRDLDRALHLDTDGDGALTWGELHGDERALGAALFSTLSLSRAAAGCSFELAPLGLVEHSDGRYARFPFTARCADGQAALTLDYSFFFALDPQHRAIVSLTSPGADQTAILTATQRQLRLGKPSASASHGGLALVGQGVGHILSGLDHVLFLIALLLPSVLRRHDDAAPGAVQLRAVLRDVIKVVTAFTVAHSLTLGLAALGLVNLSASVIEPAIAASVAIAALDNVRPVFGEDRWSIAFALGLLHGFGFSSALSDLGLHGGALLRGLFAFNAGVELGQLALVALFVPLAFLLRREWVYRFVFLRAGSLAIAALSLVWFVTRVRGG
jgi:hypothetical protein